MATPFAEYLERNKVRLDDLAKEIRRRTRHRVTASMLSMIAAGKRFPGRVLADKISKVTGLDVKDLLYPKGTSLDRSAPAAATEPHSPQDHERVAGGSR